MILKALSIPKFEPHAVCEDASVCRDNLIAISDGAGGGGVYAERWSKYLVDNLPSTPIISFQNLDSWLDSIWEDFYNDCETDAKQVGGLLLDKFYDEGSFATLVAAWIDNEKNLLHWFSFGDSVVFHYDRETDRLQSSFGQLAEFSQPPYLINCKDSLSEQGFNSGTFQVNGNSVVFMASDALAHYIIMMYEISHQNSYTHEINELLALGGKNSNYLKMALLQPNRDFKRFVVDKLCNSIRNKANFHRHLQALYSKGLIAVDDYSFAIMYDF